MKVRLDSLADTRRLAGLLLQRVGEGGLLLLAGPLGAGKTTLVGLLVEELGSGAQVSSPTYTLVHEYPTPEGTVVHMDAYRLPDTGNVQELGLDDYLERSRLVIVEWGEPLREEYPEAWLVRMERDENGRSAETFAPAGTS